MQNIVLLHGALGFAGDLSPLAESLKTSGFSVHSLTFSGHGTTPFQNNFGIEQFSMELENFINERKLKNVIVFGYSMGGFVALHLAGQQNDLIKKIITLGTKFDWSKVSVEKETKMLNPEIIQQKVPAFAKLLETKHGTTWKEVLLKTADLMRNIEKENLLNSNFLKEISTSVLIGIGDKDQMVSLEETSTVFKTLPNASMYMLPSAKHPIETVNIELLTKIITQFISKE